MIWAASRFGPRGAAFSTLLTATIAVVCTAAGVGPFARPTLLQGLFSLQTFMAVAAASTLVLACAIAERDRAVAAHARSESRASFVAHASAVLSKSLSLDATVDSLTRLLVPELADWCTIVLRDLSDGLLRRVAVVHADPAKAAAVERYRATFPPEGHRGPAVLAILETREAALIPVVGDAELEATAQSPEHLEVMRQLGVSSALLVPLIARDQVSGVLSLLRSSAGQSYTTEDLALAEDLAARAGLALDNSRLYELAQRAIRAREETLAIVSHDLKNPLAAILSRAKLVEQSPPPDRALTWVTEQAEGIRRSVQQMTTLIDQLLDTEMLRSGKVSLDCQTVSARVLVEEAIASYAPNAKAHGSELVAAFGDSRAEQVEVLADRPRVLQILSNLVGNALKFTPSGGHVWLSVSPAKDAVWFEVRDDGPGIPAADQPRIFNRFWHGRGGGVGLGLFIVKQLVQAHGGDVRVLSEGQGCSLSFSLPKGGRRIQSKSRTT